jgi:hypothetical protein
MKKPKAIKRPSPSKVFGSNGVFYRFPQGFEGQVQVSIDFSKIPAPARYYYADSLRVRIDKEMRMAILSFGHRNENTDKFADRVDVVMPMAALLVTFWASAQPIEAAVDKILETFGVVVEPLPIGPSSTEAATLFANVLFAAAGDGETSLDFYHLAPREMFLAKTQRSEIKLQPTIRVIMSTVLTKHFLNVLRPLAERISNTQQSLERNSGVARSR